MNIMLFLQNALDNYENPSTPASINTDLTVKLQLCDKTDVQVRFIFINIKHDMNMYFVIV